MNNLNKICQYEEVDIPPGPCSIHYLDYVFTKSKTQLLEIRNEIRDATIGAIVDDDIDAYETVIEKNGYGNISNLQKDIKLADDNSNTNLATIGIKLQSISANPNMFISFDDVESEVIKEWICEGNSNDMAGKQNPINISRIFKYDDNSGKDVSKRILSRLISASNLVAMCGRFGPGNFVLVSPKIKYKYPKLDLDKTFPVGGLEIVYSELVDDNKLYVIRVDQNKNGSNSMYVKYNKPLNEYFLIKTPIIKNSCVLIEIES